MSEILTPAQRRTLPARQALAARFASPEEKRAYYTALGQRGNDGRVILRRDEAMALAQAADLLVRLAGRVREVTDAS